jgi:hypothetical protein
MCNSFLISQFLIWSALAQSLTELGYLFRFLNSGYVFCFNIPCLTYEVPLQNLICVPLLVLFFITLFKTPHMLLNVLSLLFILI